MARRVRRARRGETWEPSLTCHALHASAHHGALRACRELKLRAETAADRQAWVEALTREGLARIFDAADGAAADDADDLSDDENPLAPGNPFLGPRGAGTDQAPTPPPPPPA